MPKPKTPPSCGRCADDGPPRAEAPEPELPLGGLPVRRSEGDGQVVAVRRIGIAHRDGQRLRTAEARQIRAFSR